MQQGKVPKLTQKHSEGRTKFDWFREINNQIIEGAGPKKPGVGSIGGSF